MARQVDREGRAFWLLDDVAPAPSSAPAVPASGAARPPKAGEKHPAIAFSLSLLVWGAGQLYNRQWQWGLFYFLCMVNFYLFPVVVLGHWRAITAGLRTLDVAPADILAPLTVFFMAGLVLWAVNAIHAYWIAAETRSGDFQGMPHPLLPAVCSILVPGWGQFLNGQIKKGAVLLCCAIAGWFAAATVAVVPLVWPTLVAPSDRLFAERLLLIALAVIPPVLVVWGIGVYDAIKVCVDPLKREPLGKRIEYAVNRMRLKGWRGMRPRVELTLMVSLYLVCSLILSHYYFPRNYYAGQLRLWQTQLARHEMQLIPKRLDRVIQRVSSPGPSRPDALLM